MFVDFKTLALYIHRLEKFAMFLFSCMGKYAEIFSNRWARQSNEDFNAIVANNPI